MVQFCVYFFFLLVFVGQKCEFQNSTPLRGVLQPYRPAERYGKVSKCRINQSVLLILLFFPGLKPCLLFSILITRNIWALFVKFGCPALNSNYIFMCCFLFSSYRLWRSNFEIHIFDQQIPTKRKSKHKTAPFRFRKC